jgi:hypothetical protein
MDGTKIIPRTSQVVVAVFTNVKNAKDAICDLRNAGFDGSQIKIGYAQSAVTGEPTQAHGNVANQAHGDVATAEHTLPWRLKESFEQDLYQQGADQLAGQTPGVPRNEHAPFTEIDLQQALTEIGVAPERIVLLEREVRSGVLMLVEAREHADKVEKILEANNGTIRTDTAFERPPKVA